MLEDLVWAAESVDRRIAFACYHSDFDERFAGPAGNSNFQGSLFLASYDQIDQRRANRIASCPGACGILMR